MTGVKILTPLCPLSTGSNKRLVDRLTNAVLHTTYMGTVNSSSTTKRYSASLAGTCVCVCVCVCVSVCVCACVRVCVCESESESACVCLSLPLPLPSL